MSHFTALKVSPHCDAFTLSWWYFAGNDLKVSGKNWTLLVHVHPGCKMTQLVTHAALILNLYFSTQNSTFLKNINYSGTHDFKSLQSWPTVLPPNPIEIL